MASPLLNPRDRNYFCDHCKIPCHSKEICFKLIGYLSGFKPSQLRRFAAYATTDTNAETQSQSSSKEVDITSQPSAYNITMKQYTQLMTLLAQNNTSD